MKKLKIGIIVGAIVLLAVMIGLGFILWPILAKLSAPIWGQLITPYSGLFVLAGFAACSIWLGQKKLAWWIKIPLFILSVSACSVLTGVNIVEICLNPWYQLSAALFFFSYLLREVYISVSESGEGCKNEEEKNDEKEACYYFGTFISMCIMAVMTVIAFHFYGSAGWFLSILLGVLAWFLLGGLSITPSSSEGHEGMCWFYVILTFIFLSIMIFSRPSVDKELLNARPSTSETGTSQIESFIKKNNCEKSFKADDMDIPFKNGVLTLDGDIIVNKNGKGDCVIGTISSHVDEDFYFKTDTVKTSFTIITSGGKLIVPTGAILDVGSQGFNIKYKVPIQMN